MIDCSPRPTFARNPLRLALALTAIALPVVAQTPADGGFDEARAFVSEETIFVPFRVTDSDISPLKDAIADGALQTDTWLVIMEHTAGRLAMVMDQMAYHHVAQGVLMGEPWMVSF